MREYSSLYNDKCVSALEAVRHISNGSTVVLAHAMAEPPALVDALTKNYKQYKDVSITHMVSHGSGAYCNPEMEGHLKFRGLFLSANTRKAVEEGRGEFLSIYLHEIPRMLRSGNYPCDVAMIMVSKPDKHGYCYLGVSCDYTMQAVRSAKLVLAQCNDYVPRTNGSAYVHISQLDYIVESSHPLKELDTKEATDTEKAIGEYCASLVEDNSTLQLGIGGIPNAVMTFMKGKKDLGVHSEMISDWIIDLTEEGIITGKKKTLHPGKIIAAFMMGSHSLYEYVDRNPVVELHDVDYVNHPCVIRKNSKMVSINSCMEVDLMGQVAAESIGLKQFSGVGGQVDFIRGTAMAEDEKGISIIAMPSVTLKKDGTKISKIKPLLTSGATITTTRNDVGYIVTEYGIAEMKWKTLNERARNLIKIAHPDFRDELIEEYEKRFREKF